MHLIELPVLTGHNFIDPASLNYSSIKVVIGVKLSMLSLLSLSLLNYQMVQLYENRFLVLSDVNMMLIQLLTQILIESTSK